MFNQEILANYNNSITKLELLAPKIQAQLVDALQSDNVKVHDISGRIKTQQSLSGKLARPDKIYKSLDEITDLIGLRIVTYFEDDIDTVGKIIEKTFLVDYDHSIDKRQTGEPNYFGYQSLHYVCRLADDAEIAFEVQIRTILQHTWAEIEHDLGYKFPESVPLVIRRRFSRLAGLLELADQEFSSIKKDILDYQRKLNTGEVPDTPLTDELSVKAIVSDPKISQFEEDLCQALDLEFREELFYPPYLIKMLAFCGLKSKTLVLAYLANHQAEIISFSKKYSDFTCKAWGFTLKQIGPFKSGYSLFLMAHFKVFAKEALDINKLEYIRQFYSHMDYPSNPDEALRIAKIFLEMFSENN